jgi:hypothetical protein
MAITGVHTLMHSTEPEALRAMLRDVFGWRSVDLTRDGRPSGWVIFALPPAELGVHPSDDSHHEISFMCDDIEATVAELRGRGVEFSGEITNAGFGITATMRLPGGVDVLLYEPRHETAI